MTLPQARTVGDLVTEMARLYPENFAIIHRRRRMTFAELEASMKAHGSAMLAAGVQKGDIVSVLSANTPEWLEIAVGCASIGAVLCPLNTWNKDDELRRVLERVQPNLLFVGAAFAGQDLPGMVSRILGVRDGDARTGGSNGLRLQVIPIGVGASKFSRYQTFLDAGESGSRGVEQPAVAAEDVAFICFTSGSDAEPKGVLLEHGKAVVNGYHIGERQQLVPGDRLWLGTPLFYGFGLVNALPAAWTHGAALVIQDQFEPGEALSLIETERATAYYAFGNMTRKLLQHPDLPRRDISSLRTGLTGFSEVDIRLAVEELGVTGCCSMYGQTEAHGLCFLSDSSDPVEVRMATQGRPIDGWEYRLDTAVSMDESLPPGAGELLVKGRLSPGYFNDSCATRDAFTDDGFLRTGDLALIDQNGRMIYVGRRKEMIKVGAINVAPVEVEALLQTHPDVDDAYVVGVSDAERFEVLAAFVVAKDRGLGAGDLKAHVKARASSFKVPTHVYFIDATEVPRTTSGKVLKRSLREMADRLANDEN
ncbi:AMP-binding protein [Streptomyces sp. NPDC001982]|uniref:class I adenylate-forming enzyme family protein n=1 Tax=Streptomyces sp. NPDC001982 TaxID=3154405 RepID=UPI0033329B9B